MRKVLFSLFLIWSCVGLSYSASPGVPRDGVTLDAAANTIPVAYDTSAGSQVMSELGGVSHVALFNDGLGETIAVHLAGVSCEGSDPDHYYVPDGVGLVIDNVAVNKVVCVRSVGLALTTGLLYVSAW